MTHEKSETELLKEQVEQLTADLEKEKKEYLFLMAEFDNFRKRSLKEKAELIKNGGETAFKNLLPVVDDFERAMDAIAKNQDAGDALAEGVSLIYSKFVKYLEQGGICVKTPLRQCRRPGRQRYEGLDAGKKTPRGAGTRRQGRNRTGNTVYACF